MSPMPLISLSTPSLPPSLSSSIPITTINTNTSSYNSQLSRRSSLSLLISLLPLSLYDTQPTLAFSFGISGPKDWLKEQKKKSSKYVLAPIDASRNILRSAFVLLTKEDSDYSEKDAEQVQRMLSTAGQDCVVHDRNSFTAFQAKTGVEVCTFQLVVNNAASLLTDKNPVKLEAQASLTDLIRSFGTLNAMANETDSSRQKVADALMDTISSLDKFEQDIKDCLEI